MFCCAAADYIRSTWIALAGTLGIVMPSGSSVAFVYGFILCVACNLCMSASLGELSSIWPTAGGQYHWAYSLASEKWKTKAVRKEYNLTQKLGQLPETTVLNRAFSSVGSISLAG